MLNSFDFDHTHTHTHTHAHAHAHAHARARRHILTDSLHVYFQCVFPLLVQAA